MPVLAPSKDPSSVLKYGFDWTDWLNGDTISTGGSGSSWTVSPAGLSVVGSSKTTTTTTVTLSGGDVGVTYLVTNTIVTAGGETDQRTLVIAVQDR